MKLKNSLFNSLLISLLCISVFNCSKPGDNQDQDGPDTIPTVTTTGTTNITTNSAASGGAVTDDGGSPIIEKGICYSQSPAPTTANTKITASNTPGNFAITINGLSPNTTYYVRAYATNAVGTAYGNELSFHTSTAPYVVTDPAVTMYVSGGFSGKLFALKATDGTVKWSATLGGHVTSSPIYANGMVYVGCMDNKLYAYDTIGNLKWTAPITAYFHECPLVGNGLIYYPETNSISAFNAVTGALVWKINGPGKNLVLKDNVIYSNNYKLYAINALTGVKLWEYRTDDAGEPLVFDDRIYVVNTINSDSLNVINRTTGALIWGKKDYGLFNDVISMNMKHGNLYLVLDIFNVNFNSEGLNVLDSATATLKFPRTSFTVSDNYGDNISPVFADSLAFVPADYRIYAINAFNGQMLYSLPVTANGSTYSAPTIANDLIYYTQESTFIMNPNTGGGYYAGYIHAYDYKTKTLRWSQEFKDIRFILATPCVVTQSGKVLRGGLLQ